MSLNSLHVGTLFIGPTRLESASLVGDMHVTDEWINKTLDLVDVLKNLQEEKPTAGLKQMIFHGRDEPKLVFDRDLPEGKEEESSPQGQLIDELATLITLPAPYSPLEESGEGVESTSGMAFYVSEKWVSWETGVQEKYGPDIDLRASMSVAQLYFLKLWLCPDNEVDQLFKKLVQEDARLAMRYLRGEIFTSQEPDIEAVRTHLISKECYQGLLKHKAPQIRQEAIMLLGDLPGLGVETDKQEEKEQGKTRSKRV